MDRDRDHDRASLVMFQEGAGELMWELIPDPASTAFPPGLWLMRAAAFVRAGDTDPARREALMDHFRRPSDNDYTAMGKYLMGLESQESLLTRAVTDERRTEIAYYTGLKAEGKRRYYDAAAWYRLVLETGRAGEYEYKYALDALSVWRNAVRSLDLLAAE